MTPATQKVLSALRKTSAEYVDLRSDHSLWHGVYLDNAKPVDMSNRSWAGHLGVLEKMGLYCQANAGFGEVKCSD
jgi:hypothetical protein